VAARNPEHDLGRRTFLAVTGGGAAGLAVAAWLPRRAEGGGQAPFAPSAVVAVAASGAVTVTAAKSEMGQGIRTSIPMLVAEELEVDWKDVRVEPAVADPRYGNMGTGGSRTIRQGYLPLRQAGAAAREMLVAAAAARWKVAPGDCRAERGHVLGPRGKRVTFGSLVADAAKLPVPQQPRLKEAKDFRIVGTRVVRLDVPDKVTGKAVFGMDVRLGGMQYAVVARPPAFGGKARGFDPGKALALPGVRKVAPVPSGIAVIADSTWAALRGREALSVEWDGGPDAALDSAAVSRALEAAAAGPADPAEQRGDAAAALSAAAKRLEARYRVPYLAHATMEPMNATVHARADGAEAWLPTQSPQWAQEKMAEALGIPKEKVVVHTTLLGGGFGRRSSTDFAVEAALVSRAAGGPVQVLWTREDDMRHDFYRPASLHVLEGGLDASGALVAWRHRIAAQSIVQQLFGAQRGNRPDVAQEATDLGWDVPHWLVETALVKLGVPVGWWRSVYATQNGFAQECFVDELSAASGQDPVSFRRRFLPAGSRLRRVLDLAAEEAGWGRPLPAGRARGVACLASFGSFVAQVAEIRVEGGKLARVERVVCAVDCGQVVNPDTVEAQVEGSIAYGLSAALRGEITIEKGGAREGNFDAYAPIRMSEMPAVETHLVPSGEPPGGIGEPATPTIAPAVVNALAAATGNRVRTLPIGA